MNGKRRWNEWWHLREGDAYTIMTIVRTEPQNVFCSHHDELLDCLFTGALGLVFFICGFMCNVLIVIVAYKSIVWSNAFRQHRNGCYRMWMWTVMRNNKCIVANWRFLNNSSFNLPFECEKERKISAAVPINCMAYISRYPSSFVSKGYALYHPSYQDGYYEFGFRSFRKDSE